MMQRTNNFSPSTKEDFMKSLATMTAIAALIAGMTVANAQNPAGSAGSAAPGNLNSKPIDNGSNVQSGTETPGAAAVKGSSTVTTTPGANTSASPSAANAIPNDGGSKTMSGTQPMSTQSQSGGSATTKASTTGAAQSPADPNAKPPTSTK
jgi:hypothetical protein